MAASFNRVILLGNLTRTPELRHIPNGTAVSDIGVAVNDRRKGPSGDWIDETTFVDITLWGRTAEIAAEYLTKGSPVLIEGRLKLDTWESDGQKRSKLKVIGEKMQLIGSNQRNADDSGGYSRQDSQKYQSGGSQQYSRSPQQPAPPQDYYDAVSDGDEPPF
ncbi:MAG: single-stranded DNA-binding protein [Planctomycetaceae bacterium]|jgi:single-strand DNA-binding protein|nr:single-stranded DNA-binding protein [Planctomycetaceae bacterium]